MADDKIVHFEQLWEQAESVSSKINADKSLEELKKIIIELINAYESWNKLSASDEVKTSLKKRSLGEMVFIITALSSRDNIDVYSALKEQVFLNELALKQ